MKTVIFWILLIGILLNTYFVMFISKEPSIWKLLAWWFAYFFISWIMFGAYIAFEENEKMNEEIKKKKDEK